MKKIMVLLLAACFSLAAWASGPVNINSASAEDIADSLTGIGLSKAQAIVAYREEHGAFIHIDELVNVKGIGVRTVDRNRGMILLQDAQEPASD
ncbi:MAG: helix-hairpin-helix domain-containing protein [Lysobacterales bacterium]